MEEKCRISAKTIDCNDYEGRPDNLSFTKLVEDDWEKKGDCHCWVFVKGQVPTCSQQNEIDIGLIEILLWLIPLLNSSATRMIIENEYSRVKGWFIIMMVRVKIHNALKLLWQQSYILSNICFGRLSTLNADSHLVSNWGIPSHSFLDNNVIP